MKVDGFTGTLNIIFTWITRIALLNIMWVFFSLKGIIIAGSFPATVSALTICRKWKNGEHDIPIWKTFKSIYSREFKVSNIIGWTITMMGILLYLNFLVMSNNYEKVPIIVLAAFYLMTFLFSILAVWIFPLISRYNASIIQHLKNAMIIGIVKIHYTLVIFILLFSVVYFSLLFPGMIPFFSFSLAILSWSWISEYIFKKVEST